MYTLDMAFCYGEYEWVQKLYLKYKKIITTYL